MATPLALTLLTHGSFPILFHFLKKITLPLFTYSYMDSGFLWGAKAQEHALGLQTNMICV
jgi:hypothetical protein